MTSCIDSRRFPEPCALAASALCGAVGDGKPFRTGRDLAAWIDLVPRQHATGGKLALSGICKRGNQSVSQVTRTGSRIFPDASGRLPRSTRMMARCP
ncbi:transposase [Burkholderia sp. MR1-5-21]